MVDKSDKLELSRLLQEVARIRACEKLLLEEFKSGSIKGTIHTSIGQEYVPTILANHAPDAFWFSNHRGHAHYLAKTRDYFGLLAEILGYEGATSSGIGGSQHFYRPGSFMSNGIQGGQLGIAAGLSSSLAGKRYSSIFFMGDGTTGAGHIYEALNIATLHQSKLLVILENNGIAQSTPTNSTISGSLRHRFAGFGLEYLTWNPGGKSVRAELEELNSVLIKAVRNMNQSIPTLVDVGCRRLGPHSKGDDNRPSETIIELEAQDYLNRAIADNLYSGWDDDFEEIQEVLNQVKKRGRIVASSSKSDGFQLNPMKRSPLPSTLKLRESVNSGLRNAISNYSSLLIGEDITDFPIPGGNQYGGAFKATAGLSSEFPQMVHNFPISESGMLGFAIGVAVTGRSVIVEIMFSDFIAQGLDQIIHQISKLQSIYGQSIEIPLLIRTASGPGRGYGPTHSHTLESQLVGLPNLEVVCANPFISYQDILEVWFEKKVCFIVFEPKELYPYSESDFESSMYQIQLPKNLYEPVQITSKHLKADVTIVVYGSAVWRVIERLDELLFSLEICVEVLIPTVISNWDVSTLYNSLLMSDGKLIVITDNLKSNGFLDSVIIKAFSDGAIKRLECLNFSDWIPSGFSEEEVIHTAARIRETLQRILNR